MSNIEQEILNVDIFSLLRNSKFDIGHSKFNPIISFLRVEPHGQEPVAPAVRRNPPKLQSSFAKASEDTRIPSRPGGHGFLRRRVKPGGGPDPESRKYGRDKSRPYNYIINHALLGSP
jgi:hypothetical protein